MRRKKIEVGSGSTLSLDRGVINYIDNWFKTGCGVQARRVFDKLARSMPTPCVETICIRMKNGRTELLVVRRDDPDDKIYYGQLHSIGAAFMLKNYINKYASEEVLNTFPSKLINKVKEDEVWWGLSSERTVMLRIFRNDLGLKDQDCVSLIDRAVFAGTCNDLTPRGGETALVYIFLIEAEDELKITKPVDWLEVTTLGSRKDFTKHQVERVRFALKALK